MNAAALVARFGHKCIETLLLEHWLGQKSGRTHRTVTARRGILCLREKPFTLK